MEDALKGSSCGASTDGTTAMDVDGVAFLVKQLKDVDATKTTCCGSSFRWRAIAVDGVGWRE